MTLHLHWWYLPIALLLAGVVIIPFTRNQGGYFQFPSWHLLTGVLLIAAALCVFIGGLIS